MSFPRYPKYKDSGVAWLGEVPVHWEVKSIKRLAATLEQGWSPQCEGFPAQSDDEWGVLKVGCVNGGVFRPEENKALPPELEPIPTLSLAAGDLLVSRANTRELVGGAAIVLQAYPRLMLCDKLYRIRLHPDACVPKYLASYLGTAQIRSQIELAATGASSSMLNIGQSTILELEAPVPPLSEQTAITTFLDRETAKIDALVAEQEKLIALLQEKRQAVISHAVTKGLDPNVPMKDSGVEWLGEVPRHWEVLPLKRISPQQTVGIVVNPSEYVSDEGLPFIYGGNVTEGRIDHISSRRISPEDSLRNEKTRLKAGDLITVRVGAPGITAVVPPECEGGNCASVMLVRQGKFNSDWLCFVMNSRVVRFQVETVQYGAAQEQFNINHAVEFVIPQPPRAEQDALASFLTSETTRLGNLEVEARTAITLLQERRTALISAAVTGQIDVRRLAGSVNAPDSIAVSACPVSA